MRRTVVAVFAVAAVTVAGACSGDPTEPDDRGNAEDTTVSPTAGPGEESPTDTATPAATPSAPVRLASTDFEVPAGSHPHDVAPAVDGGIWFTAQNAGHLGHLDPASGRVTGVPLGDGSAPHGVVTGPDGAAWVTDAGLNAIVRVDGTSRQVRRFPLPADRPDVHLNTATFDGNGALWFTGQNGVYGRLDPRNGRMQVYDAPGGPGPYGIATTPSGDVYYASLAGSHIARIDIDTGKATRLDPPTPQQGARRVWSDRRGRIWVSEWLAGQLARYDPENREWREWPMPGDAAQPYAVYVDETDAVWVSDFGTSRLLRFDPETERFQAAPGEAAEVRQILGRRGEVWGAESGLDELVVIRTRRRP